jgi:hypothetical protein
MVPMMGLTEMEFQNEIQDPSTAESPANNVRNSSAQDDCPCSRRAGMEGNKEFEEILQVLAGC